MHLWSVSQDIKSLNTEICRLEVTSLDSTSFAEQIQLDQLNMLFRQVLPQYL